MRQSVNLFTEALAPRRVPLAAPILIALLLALVLGLGLLGAWQQWTLGGQRARVHHLSHSVATAQADLDRRAAHLRTRQDTGTLDLRLARLERERAAKQRLAGRADAGDFGNLEGFSGYLSGLGRHHPDGLWLTGIFIAQGGRELLLEGSTLRGERLPRFIEALAGEEWFAGRPISALELRRPEATADRLDFVLLTPCFAESGERLAGKDCQARIRSGGGP